MNQVRIGIRREDKSPFERRVPLTPSAVRGLLAATSAQVLVQSSTNRIYKDEEYLRAGAEIHEDLATSDLVFAVKEIPVTLIEEARRYFFFSHTIKGQPYNMLLLRRMLEQQVTLVDYECIVDEEGRRLVFFGPYAGLAGMIDTLAAYGARLQWEGKESIFSRVRRAYEYESLVAAEAELEQIGRELPAAQRCSGGLPLVVGITGYGNVSQGAQRILDRLPCESVDPLELLQPGWVAKQRADRIYKVVFHEEHMFRRRDGGAFDLQDYFAHPEEYQADFERFLPHLTLLINAIFWNERCPRLVTRDSLARLWPGGALRKLKVIGDISIDIEGAIECSLKATHSDDPCYVYDPRSGEIAMGVAGDGPVIMAVDNLPCEIPRESSNEFSRALEPFLPAIVAADWDRPLADLELPEPILRAIVIHRGELTPDFAYMQKFLD
jgi:alpha-aminoadipic semialdehyde synthase